MRTILIFDDDQEDLETITQAFHTVDPTTHCLCYRNPTVAISQLNTHSMPQVDCILIDMHMPGMDGIQLLRKFREMPRFKGVDIMMISTQFREGESDMLFRIGAKAACLKPSSWKGYLMMATAILDGNAMSGSVLSF